MQAVFSVLGFFCLSDKFFLSSVTSEVFSSQNVSSSFRSLDIFVQLSIG